MSISRLMQMTSGGADTAWTLNNVTIPPYGFFSVSAQDSNVSGIFFKPDGLKMYVIGTTGDDVNEYDLSAAWDVSTASYVQNFSVAAQETSPANVFFKPDGTKMYVVGSIGDDVNEYNLSTAWDISTASYLQSFSVSAQETNPQSVFFKPDGLKMYVVGFSGDDVNEYNLSIAWDISTSSYVQNFSVAVEDTSPRSISFKPDGLKMYVLGATGLDVNEYNLSTAWDISTASYVQNFSVSAEDSLPRGVFFKPDGLKMYIIGTTGRAVYEYNLSTAWDISTASWNSPANSYFSVLAEDSTPSGVFFKPDGLKVYVAGDAGNDINEYNLSIAWDISTASYLQSFSVAVEDSTPSGIFFKPDGLKMYVIGNVGDNVNQYNLSTAWDISTASYVHNFNVSNEDSAPQGLFFKPDGLQMYVIGANLDAVWKYDLSTAWDISTATIPFYGKFSVSAQETSPRSVFFKPDGLKMYVLGIVGDDVNEYNLSTAWDTSTASYVQNFSVLAQETNPLDVFFKPDGLKMYIIGTTGDDVNEYNLSTAWDVSTASYLQNFSVAAQETSPNSIFFKPDGLKMYIIGTSGDDVNEYNLSTAWDVSTASYLQNFSVAAQDLNPSDVFFKPDGLKMYVVGASGDDVIEYNLSTAWDVSTASYLQNLIVSAQDTNPSGVFFKPDGTKMYVVGFSGSAVYEYNLSTAWDISTSSWNFPANSYFSFAAQETSPTSVFFKPDGLKMYIIGTTGDDVNEYDLSIAWDISTASYVQNFSVAGEEITPTGFFFKPDGTQMYVIGSTKDAIWAYSLV